MINTSVFCWSVEMEPNKNLKQLHHVVTIYTHAQTAKICQEGDFLIFISLGRQSQSAIHLKVT